MIDTYKRDEAIRSAVLHAMSKMSIEQMKAQGFFGVGSWRRSQDEALAA